MSFRALNATILIVLLLLLTSCSFMGPCQKKRLPQSAVKEMSRYHQGQQFIYTSDLGRTDTLTVTDTLHAYTPCNKFELGPNQYEMAGVYFKSHLFEGHINVSYNVRVTDSFERFFRFSNVMANCRSDEIHNYVDSLKLASQEDKIKVYTVNAATDTIRSYKGKIQSFAWSEQYGFVQYTTVKGEVFKLLLMP